MPDAGDCYHARDHYGAWRNPRVCNLRLQAIGPSGNVRLQGREEGVRAVSCVRPWQRVQKDDRDVENHRYHHCGIWKRDLASLMNMPPLSCRGVLCAPVLFLRVR